MYVCRYVCIDGMYVCMCACVGLSHGPSGKGIAPQNRGSSGEGIWIIKPIAGNYMMAIMGAKVTLCEVAMLGNLFGGHAHIHGRGVCDWLQEEAGFSAAWHQEEQRLIRRGHLDHQTATTQLMHFTRRGVIHGREGHAVPSGNV